MNNVYFIGGPARTGKTTISEKLLREINNTDIYSLDKIRDGVRSIFSNIFDMHILNIELEGKLTIFNSKVSEEVNHDIKINGDDKFFVLKFLVGLLKTYDKDYNNKNVIVEGDLLTPEFVKRLKFKNLQKEVLFFGYKNEKYIDEIFKRAKRYSNDWINNWINQVGGDELIVRDELKKEIRKSFIIEKECNKYGYKFIDVSKISFNKLISESVEILKNID